MHNIILHFLAETGLIGMGLLACALYLCKPTHYRTEYIPFYGIIGIQVLHSMLEFPYAYMPWLIVLGLSIGIVNAKRKNLGRFNNLHHSSLHQCSYA